MAGIGRGIRSRRASQIGSPGVVAEQAELRLLRHQHHRRGGAPLRNLALSLHRLFQLPRIRQLRLRLSGRRQLRECLAHARLGRDVGHRCGSPDAGCRDDDRRRNDGRLIGVEDDALGPFALGMNADGRSIEAGIPGIAALTSSGIFGKYAVEINNSASNAPPTNTKYRNKGIFQASLRPHERTDRLLN